LKRIAKDGFGHGERDIVGGFDIGQNRHRHLDLLVFRVGSGDVVEQNAEAPVGLAFHLHDDIGIVPPDFKTAVFLQDLVCQ